MNIRLKSKRLFILVSAFVVALSGVSGLPVSAAAEMQGVTRQTVAGNLTAPVGMRFAPDGRIFVAEKFGTIKVIKNGAVSTFGAISVNGDYEQGLLGLVLDPDFTNNGYIYIAYTVPDGNSNRISRITASASNPDVMQEGSETVLLQGIPSPTGIHEIGELQIGPDGKLYIPAGDGAIDAQTSQSLDSLNGKILRINLDGSIPTDNPFYGQAGKRAEIWAYGLRNPYSSAVQPGTGRMFVNDVGQDEWEEINELQRGANYGWTECEGRCNPAREGFTDPIYQYSHTSGDVYGRSITGGAWYEGGPYPADFVGDYFFADYTSGWIKKLDPASMQVVDIASGLSGVVNLKVGPDGLLYYVQLDVSTGSGSVNRLAVASTGTPAPDDPSQNTDIKVYAAGTPALGEYPTAELLIDDVVAATFTNVRGDVTGRQFIEYAYTAGGAITPERIKVRYPNDYYAPSEDRNLYVDRISLNGTEYQTEDPGVVSTGTWTPETGCAAGNKQAEVLSCGGYFQYAASQVVQNDKPLAVIDSPKAEAFYRAGETIEFSGTATDPEDGALGADSLSWNIVYYHDTHAHPFMTFTGRSSGSFTIPDTGESSANTFYRLQLTAKDGQGETGTVIRDVYPRTAQISLQTSPTGLEVAVDGQPKASPYSFYGVAGFKRTVSAPLTQTMNGESYEFVEWSDGGAATHEIRTPDSPLALTATYRKVDPAQQPTDSTAIKVYAAGTSALGEYPTAELLVDDKVVATYTNVRGNPGTRQFVELSHVFEGAVTPERVKVRYPNDYYAMGEDRNLYVDKISLNGIPYESEDSSVVSTGTWTPETGCAPGNKQAEVISCGGYFQYGSASAQPAPQGSELRIFAAGQPAQGIYPTLELAYGSSIAKVFTGVQGDYAGRIFQELTYVSDTKLDLAQLQIRFTNDAMVDGEDRNLHIDKIVLDGVVYEAEGPSVYSIGSWNSATGCEGGYKSSETLSCNGYFSFRQ